MVLHLWTFKTPTCRRDISHKVTITKVILNDRWCKNNNLKYKYKMLIIFFYVMNIIKLNKIEKYKLKESIDIIERNNELF